MTTEPRPLHTEGPWENNGNAVHKRVSPHYAKCICVCDGDDRYFNAALIARAPELLHQAEWLEGALQKMKSMYEAERDTNTRLQATLTAVRTELATLQASHSKNVELLAHATEKAVELTSENQRLRELLRECKKYLPLKGHTYNAMECQESKLGERIDKELGQ